MPILFIPKDPGSPIPPQRHVDPSAERASSRVRLAAGTMPAEAIYLATTEDFVSWQCREAALRTLDLYEDVCGPLPSWRGSASATQLAVIPLQGVDLNAYYDRYSVRFFRDEVGGRTVYSGASTDIVAHEVGHAILDAIRPDMWNVPLMEVGAFHEGFGDCIALMVALSDDETRDAVLAADPDLRGGNFAETLAKEVPDAVAIKYPGHNAGAPRRALNNFQWALHQTLPDDGPPGTLINEDHSLGQLVSGVYYDLICRLWQASGADPGGLWDACRRATQLIVDGVKATPIDPRFMHGWGRATLLGAQADPAEAALVRAAFGGHGIDIDDRAAVTPSTSIGRSAFRTSAAGAGTLPADAAQRMKVVLGARPRTSLAMRYLDLGETPILEVSADLRVDLSSLSSKLGSTVSHVPHPAWVGESAGGMAVLGGVQSRNVLAEEVRDYVARLVKKNAIDYRTRKKRRPKIPAGFVNVSGTTTHVVKRKGDEQVLTRVAFSCCCGCC